LATTEVPAEKSTVNGRRPPVPLEVIFASTPLVNTGAVLPASTAAFEPAAEGSTNVWFRRLLTSVNGKFVTKQPVAPGTAKLLLMRMALPVTALYFEPVKAALLPTASMRSVVKETEIGAATVPTAQLDCKMLPHKFPLTFARNLTLRVMTPVRGLMLPVAAAVGRISTFTSALVWLVGFSGVIHEGGKITPLVGTLTVPSAAMVPVMETLIFGWKPGAASLSSRSFVCPAPAPATHCGSSASIPSDGKATPLNAICASLSMPSEH
jgi:hypothetical protein